MLTWETEPQDDFIDGPRDDGGFQNRVRWAIRNLNSEARVVMVCENEIALIIRHYLVLIDDIENSASKEERENFDLLRSHAVHRIDEYLLAGAIERERVDSLSQAISGKPFESPFDHSAWVMDEVVQP